mmetsp:Transcript_28987/g.79250  ORF Transcript_28987/g.79250 Transcript_28987/m.79250 type:complete len:297 (-) Transcript_28987:605-1495(-)
MDGQHRLVQHAAATGIPILGAHVEGVKLGAGILRRRERHERARAGRGGQCEQLLGRGGGQQRGSAPVGERLSRLAAKEEGVQLVAHEGELVLGRLGRLHVGERTLRRAQLLAQAVDVGLQHRVRRVIDRDRGQRREQPFRAAERRADEPELPEQQPHALVRGATLKLQRRRVCLPLCRLFRLHALRHFLCIRCIQCIVLRCPVGHRSSLGRCTTAPRHDTTTAAATAAANTTTACHRARVIQRGGGCGERVVGPEQHSGDLVEVGELELRVELRAEGLERALRPHRRHRPLHRRRP